MAAQTAALERVGAAGEGDGAQGRLAALLSNSRTHTRPGAVVLIRELLGELGVELVDGETPLALRPLGDLDIDELHQVYEQVVGRTTESTHRGYLTWKIREARKGKVKVGAIQRGSGEPGAGMSAASRP